MHRQRAIQLGMRRCDLADDAHQGDPRPVVVAMDDDLDIGIGTADHVEAPELRVEQHDLATLATPARILDFALIEGEGRQFRRRGIGSAHEDCDVPSRLGGVHDPELRRPRIAHRERRRQELPQPGQVGFFAADRDGAAEIAESERQHVDYDGSPPSPGNAGRCRMKASRRRSIGSTPAISASARNVAASTSAQIAQ
jgi:hypothetical protein